MGFETSFSNKNSLGGRFSNGWGGIRVFVRLFSQGCGIHLLQCRKEQACWKCWIGLFMSQDRKSYFPFWIEKIPRQSFVLKYEIIPSFQFFVALIYCSLVFHSDSCLQQSKACLLHCNHLLSHQLSWWKLQVKLQYMILLIFVSRQKPSNECWKTTATYFSHKQRKPKVWMKGKLVLLV